MPGFAIAERVKGGAPTLHAVDLVGGEPVTFISRELPTPREDTVRRERTSEALEGGGAHAATLSQNRVPRR